MANSSSANAKDSGKPTLTGISSMGSGLHSAPSSRLTIGYVVDSFLGTGTDAFCSRPIRITRLLYNLSLSVLACMRLLWKRGKAFLDVAENPQCTQTPLFDITPMPTY